MKPSSPSIAVVGSLNVDDTAFVAQLPRPGQTVAAKRLVRRFGGKGANQALAASRQGAKVEMVGAVGDDANGRAYGAHLEQQGIDGRGVATIARAPTGLAWIAVDDAAENFIVVVPGANAALTAAMVRRQRKRIEAAGALLVQWEVPAPAVLEAIRLAMRANVPVVMNPSPPRGGFPWGQFHLDTVIVNEGEAKALFRLDPRKGTGLSPGLLTRFGIQRLLVTRGAKPTRLFAGPYCLEIPTLAVTPVDTVGAGDTFAGVYTARRAAGEMPAEAIRAANAAAALATLKAGAQEAIPTRSTTDRALAQWAMRTSRSGA